MIDITMSENKKKNNKLNNKNRRNKLCQKLLVLT